MPRQVEGRRVDSIEAIERSGDYFVKRTEAGIESIWFAMPGFPEHLWNRINGPAWSQDGPKWEVTEDAEGRVTVSPSILSEWTWGEARQQQRFHAFLKGGVWELLDDCVGADYS